jgi:hypothetical protein
MIDSDIKVNKCQNEKKLRDRELNPGLPRDRRGYLPLYYRGYAHKPTHLTIFNIPLAMYYTLLLHTFTCLCDG